MQGCASKEKKTPQKPPLVSLVCSMGEDTIFEPLAYLIKADNRGFYILKTFDSNLIYAPINQCFLHFINTPIKKTLSPTSI